MQKAHDLKWERRQERNLTKILATKVSNVRRTGVSDGRRTGERKQPKAATGEGSVCLL